MLGGEIVELQIASIIIAAVGIMVSSFSLGFSVRGLLTPSKRNDRDDESNDADDDSDR